MRSLSSHQMCTDTYVQLCICHISFPPPLQVKCDQYWPTRGTETYGLIQVTLLDTVELATYSVRTFALYKVTWRVQRTVMGSAVYWFVEIFMGAGGYVCLRFSLRRCHGCIRDTTWQFHGFLGVFAFFKNHPSFNLCYYIRIVFELLKMNFDEVLFSSKWIVCQVLYIHSADHTIVAKFKDKLCWYSLSSWCKDFNKMFHSAKDWVTLFLHWQTYCSLSL